MAAYERTGATTIHRLPQRGAYDKPTVHAILDSAFLCHVSYVGSDGTPVTIPTGYARDGDSLLFHGHPSCGFIAHMLRGEPVCVSVTLLDGIVMARSVFHSSMNYRAVVAFGTGHLVTDDTEKMGAFAKFTEHIMPGRWKNARGPNSSEMKSTAVVRFPLAAVSAKVRSGNPGDDDADLTSREWYSAVLPLQTVSLPCVPDPTLPPGMQPPPYANSYQGPSIVPLASLQQGSSSTVRTVLTFAVGVVVGLTVAKCAGWLRQ